MFDQNLIIGLVVIAVAVMAVYSYWPRIARSIGIEKFANAKGAKSGNGRYCQN